MLYLILIDFLMGPDPTQTVPDQTWTHPRPSQSIYSISEPICSIPKGMLHWCLLSKHPRSGEHHSQTHLTIPDEPETSRIPLTNPKLACSPLNPKTQYAQPWSGKAWTPSYIPDWVLFLSLILISICLSLPLSHSLCHSFPLSTLYSSSFLPYPLVPLHQEIEDSKIILYNSGWWFDKGLTCEV